MGFIIFVCFLSYIIIKNNMGLIKKYKVGKLNVELNIEDGECTKAEEDLAFAELLKWVTDCEVESILLDKNATPELVQEYIEAQKIINQFVELKKEKVRKGSNPIMGNEMP